MDLRKTDCEIRRSMELTQDPVLAGINLWVLLL
jgi:hypothetical protein